MFEVLQIKWHPASVDEDGVGFVVTIEVCVEGSDNLDALFALVIPFYPDLSRVVVVALQLDRLVRPVIFKAIDVLASPWECTFVARSDVDWL